MWLICFDVSGEKRLRRIAKALEGVGQRVQKSVFECHLDEIELGELQGRIDAIMDKTEDHVRYYPLCGKDRPEIKIDGKGSVTTDPDYHLL